jgi:hypothetical protein
VGPEEKPSPDPRSDPHRMKLMLCIWWNMNGVIYWELLDSKSILTTAVYGQQLDKVAEAVRTKKLEKTKIILQHDNARPHTAKLTNYRSWAGKCYPTQHIARTLRRQTIIFSGICNMNWMNSTSKMMNVKKWLQIYFDQRPSIFFNRDIRRLPTKWAQVIFNHGDYIE